MNSLTHQRIGGLSLTVACLCMTCVVEPVVIPDGRVYSESHASGELAGVQVFADALSWDKSPRDLWRTLIPIEVTIQNHSGRPLRLAYGDFQLVGSSGVRSPALAPMSGHTGLGPSETPATIMLADYHPAAPVHAAPPPRPPGFHHNRFWVAPHFVYRYPAIVPWPRPFIFDPRSFVRFSWPATLPTPEMLNEALPEGVLENEGSVQGFLFFPLVQQGDPRVRLEIALINVDDGQQFGQLTMPLQVRTR